jgi:sugar lactone lactonase YvrE
MSTDYKVVCNLHCELGEGLLWSARDNAIYWVDILAPALHRYSLTTTQVTTWQMPEKIGWVIERRDHPGFIAGLQSGFHTLTLDPVVCASIVDPEPHLPGNRMNDAAVDKFGRIWAGTMDCAIAEVTGSLYCFDTTHTVSKRDSDYLITNGPAFGAEHECMYHTDTGRSVVYRFDLSADGTISGKREFLKFPEEWGTPDGMTVDAQGGLWIAHWGGSRVSRFNPDATLDRCVALPASQITNCVFGGENLDRLFVTSAAEGKADEPLAGAVFEVDPQGVRGIAPNLFAG